MSLPLLAPTPKPPAPPRDDFADLDSTGLSSTTPRTRSELLTLPSLEWDQDDGESGIKRRA